MKRFLKTKSILFGLLALLVCATLAFAITVSVRPGGIAFPYWYSYSAGAKSTYYLTHPTLTANEEVVSLTASQTLTNKTVTGTFMGNVTGDVTGDITGDHLLTLQSAEHGAGAIGTAFAPKTYRGYLVNGDILTSIHVDITGLGCKGTTDEDAIGLAAGGAAYIGKYVVATYGIVYKVEMICLEAPGEGEATITSDINLGIDVSGTIAYDGAVGAVVLDAAGAIAAGKTYQSLVPELTANYYLYLEEGSVAATTGVYNAGQLIINLYGHPVLS